MKRLVQAMRAVFLPVALLLITSSPVWAKETTCVGPLGAATVDNLRVPQNRSCTLDGTRIEGTLKVETGATLDATRINVIGNVQAEGAAAVTVTNSNNETTDDSLIITVQALLPFVTR
jgi:hypothetical protein